MSVYYTVPKEVVRAGEPIDFGLVWYVPERTCRIERSFTEPYTLYNIMEWRCSECDQCMYMEVAASDEAPSYCPNCGAKVVE